MRSRRRSCVAEASEARMVDVEIAGRIAQVTLNRPDKLNALDLDMLDELQRVTRELGRSDDVHVVVLSGRGQTFCAGADLAYIDEIRHEPTRVRQFLGALRDAILKRRFSPRSGAHRLSDGRENVASTPSISMLHAVWVGNSRPFTRSLLGSIRVSKQSTRSRRYESAALSSRTS